MAAIGVTGGIGSGKTTFCGLLAPLLGARVFDADAAAKDLLANDAEVRRLVVEALGPAAYSADGKPDRAWIRSVVYSDANAKNRLETVLHPRVRARWVEMAGALRGGGSALLVDIPLLFETGAEVHFDKTLVVGCSPEVQIARVCARGLEAAEARRIMDSQMPLPEKILRADIVVWNDGSLEMLREQAGLAAERLR
ncbi:MAG: dephospho-CoA kinase [Terrimicrobiaceae bacterium]